jgi:hypothetical protein
MCLLSRNLRASTSRNPKGLSRPVMGLLYLSFTREIRIALKIVVGKPKGKSLVARSRLIREDYYLLKYLLNKSSGGCRIQ